MDFLILIKIFKPKFYQKFNTFLKNDKKNNDDNINFILLKNIGNTTTPNNSKISITQLKKHCKFITQS